MIEPTQKEVYRLCGIEEPAWYVSRNAKGDTNIRPPAGNRSGAQVALRWVRLLNGRPHTRRGDGLYDLYESGGSTLRVKVN